MTTLTATALPAPSSSRIALVLEDDVATRALLMRALRRLSLAPIGFGSGEAALAWLELHAGAATNPANRPVLLSVDVGLPSMSGFHFAECVRGGRGGSAAVADVPIVIVTARIDVQDEARAIELGAAYLAKPFHLRDYLDTVEAIMREEDRALDVVESAQHQSVHFWSR